VTAALATSISTSSVPTRERSAYWRDQICDTFVELDCGRVGEGFYGELADSTLGPLQLTQVKSSMHEVIRSRRQIAKSTDDYFLVSLQIAGQGLVEQDGRSAWLQPGDFALYDSTRRYLLRFDDDFEELVLKLPRSMIAERIAVPERITATRIDGRQGMGRVAFDFLRSLTAELHQLPPGESTRLANTVVDLLGSAVVDGAFASHSGSASAASLLLSAKVQIRDHLEDPQLCKGKIAQALGISERYLSKLFTADGTCYSHWLREQRLIRIAEDLSRPELSERSISSIAYGWGMNSMPHFSRVFRQQFDRTPKQYRTDALASICSH